MVRRAAFVLVGASWLLTGCHFGAAILLGQGTTSHGPYRAETLARELGPGSVRTIGCLDVGLVPFERASRDHVDLHIGNRCGHPEAVDMRRAIITGYRDTGERTDVALSDPRNEIDLLHLGGAERGHERIKLEHDGSARRLCFDLEHIDPDATAARPQPMCFDKRGHAWSPV